MNYTFRKRPVIIEAFQMTQANRLTNEFWPNWLLEAWNCQVLQPSEFPHSDGTDRLKIQTLEGDMLVEWDDWIIQGTAGEIYPCKPDIFANLYDPVLVVDMQNNTYTIENSIIDDSNKHALYQPTVSSKTVKIGPFNADEFRTVDPNEPISIGGKVIYKEAE